MPRNTWIIIWVMTELLPRRLDEIIDDFQWCEGQEKIELLLQYSEQMPPLPDWLVRDDFPMEQVHECMTPVFVHAEKTDGGMKFYFDIPRESPTVRGFASILSQGLEGVTPQQVLAVPDDFFLKMGLEKVLTHRRLNGMSAILAHIKDIAAREVHLS